ncbi:hypothetical protein DERP_003482 [Dermatophagoides pteronyssinus]|uniref:Uncharacterized protein n=1 Tax=Dermatophagoides pteronyssinus TaxID=6956 RepID=A0ABQ8JLH6_DERPT|nr:hypothetical protein DERP_003482 [Dermatophagoides pteronyssinus]
MDNLLKLSDCNTNLNDFILNVSQLTDDVDHPDDLKSKQSSALYICLKFGVKNVEKARSFGPIPIWIQSIDRQSIKTMETMN